MSIIAGLAVLAGIPLFFLNDRSKRRELRLQHLADAKRETYGRLLAVLDMLRVAIKRDEDFSRVAQSGADLKNRALAYIALSRVALWDHASTEELNRIIESQNEEAFRQLIGAQIGKAQSQIAQLMIEFYQVFNQSSFLIEEKRLLDRARDIEMRLVGLPPQNLNETEVAKHLKEIFDEIQQLRSDLVHDFRSDF